MRAFRLQRRAVLLMTVVLCVALPSGAAFAEVDTSTPKYSVIYTRSSGNPSDAGVFNWWFGESGWIQEQFKNATSPTASARPLHGNFLHGNSGGMVEAADDSDIVYISGHGYPNAELPIFAYPTNDDSGPCVDSISPDTLCANTSPNEVGFAWTGGIGVNESAWDTDVEWVIMAACDQLDVHNTNVYGNNSAAKCWARTLLGSPSRAHSIMGYDGASPTLTDAAIADEFARCAFNEERSVLDSWRTANTREDSDRNWAYVAHEANRSDRLHGVGVGPTADTPANSEYTIHYLSKTTGSWQCILDDDGAEQIGQSDTPGARLVAWVCRLLLGEPAFALSERLPDAIEVQGTVFKTDTTRVGAEKRLAPQIASRLEGDLRGLMGGVKRTTVFDRDEGSSVRSERYGLNGFESYSLSGSGASEYRSERGLGTDPLVFSEAEAVGRARDFLSERGALPSDAVLSRVDAVVTTKLDLESDTPEVLKPVEYEVTFAQQVGDAVIDGNGAGIVVYVDGMGVREVYKKWFETTFLSPEVAVAFSPVSALEAAAQAAVDALDVPAVIGVKRMDLVYYPNDTSSGTALVPAWRVEFEDGSSVYVEASSNTALREAPLR